jgi:hypothetical protein
MKKIKLFGETSIVMESELGKGLSVASSTEVGGVYTFPSQSSTFLDNSYMVVNYGGLWYVFPKAQQKQFTVYVPLNGGSSTLSLGVSVVKASTVFEIRRNVGGNSSPTTFDGTLATFPTGTATISDNGTIQVDLLGDTVGAVLAVTLMIDNDYMDMALSKGLKVGCSYLWGMKEDPKGLTIPAVSQNDASAMYLKPSMFTKAVNVGGVVTVTGDIGMKVFLISEHSSYAPSHCVFSDGITVGESIPYSFSLTLFSDTLCTVTADNLITNYSNSITRVVGSGYETYQGSSGTAHIAYADSDTHAVWPNLKITPVGSSYSLVSLRGLAYTGTDVVPPIKEVPHFVVPPRDADTSVSVKTMDTASDDSLAFPSTGKVGENITMHFPRASAGNATNGGLITSTELSDILFALASVEDNKIDTVNVAYDDSLAGPTTIISGTTLTITFPKASGGNATNGGLITSTEFGDITSSIAGKVDSISVVIDNTITGPQITWVDKVATLRLPLTSSGASLGGLVTASEWQSIWDTIGSPTATPSWAGTVLYGLGNKVLHRGLVWECISSHTSADFDAELANWRISGEKGMVYSYANTLTNLTPVKVTSSGVVECIANGVGSLSEPPCVVVACNASFVAVVWGVARINMPAHGMTLDATYYISQTVLGGVTSVIPTTGIINPVFYVLDANNLLVLASPAWER